MDRLVIEITGPLPEANKYAVLAAAQMLAEKVAEEMKKTHGVETVASVRAVRPGKKVASSSQLRAAAD